MQYQQLRLKNQSRVPGGLARARQFTPESQREAQSHRSRESLSKAGKLGLAAQRRSMNPPRITYGYLYHRKYREIWVVRFENGAIAASYGPLERDQIDPRDLESYPYSEMGALWLDDDINDLDNWTPPESAYQLRRARR